MKEDENRKYYAFVTLEPVALFMIVLFVLLNGCQSFSEEQNNEYPEQFGEIYFDADLDSPDFELCHPEALVHSRVSLSYDGGRSSIEKAIREELLRTKANHLYNGYIVVRFLVNCEGKVGRLRLESLDNAFVSQTSPDQLNEILRSTIKSLDDWIVTIKANEGKDHSKYLNLKFENGKLDAVIH
ncbi:hypothetical protein [Roseivirga misakiensis]|uniref:Uncharacterized protein n=1 Tax=Roseivirga misakiensis TaxID=1563681 RepID=A0A1E5SLB1_9BACT|nr:hypothetical protein [Roseivirga misakiensis]OEJ99891.1 hypothetical protein BFP71_10105 [Roseivirga misakiensis]